jgi:hypothetical protein
MAAAGLGGLGRGGLLVCTIWVAFTMSPLAMKAKALRVLSMQVAITVFWSGAGIFKTQCNTSDFTPG